MADRESRPLRVGVLGPLRLVAGERTVEITAAKQRAVLEVLALRAGTPVSTSELITAVWGEEWPKTAPKTLQIYVSRLRRALGGPWIGTQAPGYVLAIPREHVDAHVFESTVAAARRAMRDGHPAEAVHLFDDARQLWRGAPLVDLGDTDLARAEVARLQELRIAALEERAGARIATGHARDVVHELEVLVAEHPFRELLWSQLMLALYHEGRQRDALAAYRRARRILIDELGIEPGPEMRALEQAILTQAPDLYVPAGLTPVTPSRPEAPRERGNLPRSTTRFFGRRRERDELVAQLATPGLVTLTGFGGVGKTRLATEVAAAATARWVDGIWLVELAPLADGRAVADVVARALGISVPAGARAAEVIASALSSRRCLVLLDGCEHVLLDVREVVASLVRECPLLTLLATSREPLSIPGEQIWPLEPLPLPTGDEVAPAEVESSPAVALLVDRARSARPGFELTAGNATAIVELCRRLDGLPLAIELAASQLRSVGPADLARRLDERFRILRRGPRGDTPHHRSLQETVEWSYRLLDGPERDLFDRLSVFAGEFDLDAVEDVCTGAGLDRAEVAGLLAGLVDRSMVVSRQASDGTARYLLLDTLRHYGAERLIERGERTAFQRRHSEHFAALAKRASADVQGPDEALWVARVEAAFDDVRAAHAWAVHQQDAGLALAIAADMQAFEGRNGSEVLSWAETAIGLPGAEAGERYPDACAAAARRAGLHGDLARAERLGRHSIAVAEARGTAPSSAAMYAAAVRSFAEGNEDAVLQHLRRRDLALRVEDHAGAASGQAYAALVTGYRGDTDAAVDMATEALRLAEKAGSPSSIAGALYVEGEILHEIDPGRAARRLEDALSLARSVNNEFTANITLVSLASLHARRGDPRRALELFIEVVASWRRQGAWRQQWVTLRNVAELLARLGGLAQAAVLLAAVDAAPGAPLVYGAQASRLEDLAQRITRELGSDRASLAAEHGAEMADHQVVTYAQAVMTDALGTVTASDPAWA